MRFFTEDEWEPHEHDIALAAVTKFLQELSVSEVPMATLDIAISHDGIEWDGHFRGRKKWYGLETNKKCRGGLIVEHCAHGGVTWLTPSAMHYLLCKEDGGRRTTTFLMNAMAALRNAESPGFLGREAAMRGDRFFSVIFSDLRNCIKQTLIGVPRTYQWVRINAESNL